MKSIVKEYHGLLLLGLGSVIFFADLDPEVVWESIIAIILIISLIVGIPKTLLIFYGLHCKIKIKKPAKKAKKQAEKELGKNAPREAIRERIIEILIENAKDKANFPA